MWLEHLLSGEYYHARGNRSIFKKGSAFYKILESRFKEEKRRGEKGQHRDVTRSYTLHYREARIESPVAQLVRALH